MCTVLAAAQFAVGAASSVLGFQAETAEYDGKKQMYKANVRNARQYAVDTYAHTQNRWLQERAAAGQQKLEAGIEATEARATAEVAAGEGGVSGNSVNQFLASYFGKQGRYNDTVDANYQMNRDSLWGEMEQTKNRAQSQINSMPFPQKPSFLGAALRIASTGLEITSNEVAKG